MEQKFDFVGTLSKLGMVDTFGSNSGFLKLLETKICKCPGGS